MKNLIKQSTFLLLAALLFQSCLKDTCESTVTFYDVTAVTLSVEEIRSIDLEVEAPRALKEPGKLYFYQDYIFINEMRKGIHVIDNTDEENPINVAFLNIQGNIDIAIKDGKLYADAYTELLTIDLANIDDATVVHRTEDAFPFHYEDQDGNRVVEYLYEERTEVMDCEAQNALSSNNGIFFRSNVLVAEASFDDFNPSGNSGGGGNGTGGSMARFTLVGDYLYTVSNNDMNVFDVANPAQPIHENLVNIGWGIETIFPYGDNLFIGSNSGMYIFDNTDPTAPSFLSEFRHSRACDPVYVKDNFAYVTLRDGTFCEGFDNQLDLIDITDLTNPQLVKSFDMKNPHGLSINNNELYLCEGEHGLKIFDIEDPVKLDRNRIEYVRDIFAYDVISLPNKDDILFLIGEDGFFQYDSSNPSNLKLISSIRVE